MRILVVGQTFPWPAASGAKIRLANVVAALAKLGPTDLFAFVSPERLDHPSEVDVEAASRVGVGRVQLVARSASRYGGVRRLAWFAGSDVPASLVGRDYHEAVARFESWAEGPYDLVWFSRVESYLAVGARVRAPAVVDIDDLQDHLQVTRLDLADRGAGSTGRDRIRRPFVRLRVRKDARLWSALYREIAASVDAVVVCSELDRSRLGIPNAVVVPNGYEALAQPLGRTVVGTPPTVMFQGLLQYGPNVDAARYLVERIGPSLRARLPDVQIRLVGRVDGRLRGLENPPRVVVTGLVPDIEAELARADVIAVPVRFGSGTRVKILEAFAHRIPVVSTSAGAEGIDAVDGVHLLIRDAPDAFAAACVDLLVDVGLRASLVDQAHRRFLELYRWGDIHERIGALAQSITARSPVSRGTER